ncbi:unnamed protein product [Diabrotica balteata]|uniref:Cytochrome P450 n=1 Tax=Diabrotica balteata TaxID=107213 RepID=A0A9N9STM9_DIABA|nr:unnamed protein product [Diabrotica balteata]
MLQLILLVLVIVLFYWYAIKPMNYWRDRGVLQLKPMWLFGDSWRLFLRLDSFASMFQRAYDLDPDSRIVGLYQFTTPVLMIKDPKLLKKIMLKDAEYFMNRRQILPENGDPLFTKNLIGLKDQKWKDMRHILSPSFTSSKMKTMFTLIEECSINFVKHISEKNQNVVQVTMMDVGGRFTCDVIASTAFGFHSNSLEDPNNDFYVMGDDITNFTDIKKSFKVLGFMLIPKVLEFFNVSFFDGYSRQFFLDLIAKTLREREERNIVRPDMIHLLMEAKKNLESEKSSSAIQEINVEDVTAHAIIFFFAGFDSVSSLIAFTSYELAIHPDIQDRLRQEIDAGFEECNGKMNYETLMKMKYLDMVISESLRKWPSFPLSDRWCNKTYTIEPEDPSEKPIIVQKDLLIQIPIKAIHHDSKYFPDPERFDPERFNDENKDKIDPYTYLPFGLGPRNCIGSRFALMETKSWFAHVLHNFEIVPTADTQIPVQASKKHFTLHPEGGLKLGFKRCQKI